MSTSLKRFQMMLGDSSVQNMVHYACMCQTLKHSHYGENVCYKPQLWDFMLQKIVDETACCRPLWRCVLQDCRGRGAGYVIYVEYAGGRVWAPCGCRGPKRAWCRWTGSSSCVVGRRTIRPLASSAALNPSTSTTPLPASGRTCPTSKLRDITPGQRW